MTSRARNSSSGWRSARRLAALSILAVVVMVAGGVVASNAATAGVYGWGNNQTGELADGTTTGRLTAVTSPSLASAVNLAVGAVHGLALMRDGSVVAWGHNRSGQLGNGSTSDSTTPIRVANAGAVTALAAGNAFSLAVRSDGSVVAWGKNRSGELGDGLAPANATTPTAVVGLGAGSGVVAVSAGDSHSLALKGDGTVLAWGNNQSGQLGDGTAPNDHHTPTAVSGLGPGSGVVAVAAGGAFSLALKGDGTVLAWGNNQSGELGNGNVPNDHDVPGVVSGLGPGSGVVQIAAGFASAYALKRDGTVVAWGNNRRGETGSGDAPTGHPTPVGVHVTNAVDIAAGWSHALALQGDGTVVAWGDNNLGQLGDNTTTPRAAPVIVAGFGAGSNVVAVYAAGDHSHALVGTPQIAPPTTPGNTSPGSSGRRSSRVGANGATLPRSGPTSAINAPARTTG